MVHQVKLNQRFALILEREPLFVFALQIIEHSFYEDVLTCPLVQVILWLEWWFLQIYFQIVRFLIGRYQQLKAKDKGYLFVVTMTLEYLDVR